MTQFDCFCASLVLCEDDGEGVRVEDAGRPFELLDDPVLPCKVQDGRHPHLVQTSDSQTEILNRIISFRVNLENIEIDHLTSVC